MNPYLPLLREAIAEGRLTILPVHPHGRLCQAERVLEEPRRAA